MQVRAHKHITVSLYYDHGTLCITHSSVSNINRLFRAHICTVPASFHSTLCMLTYMLTRVLKWWFNYIPLHACA